jgi:predicted RNA-binding Zn-ribbon protein involved in translation (DUF1610 family)
MPKPGEVDEFPCPKCGGKRIRKRTDEQVGQTLLNGNEVTVQRLVDEYWECEDCGDRDSSSYKMSPP